MGIKSSKNPKQPVITPDINIAELTLKYPEVIETLIVEYGFHCIGCFVSEFETLAEGARVHGIEDEDFTELLERLNKLVLDQSTNTAPTG
jgi:hybrid cluster-associated redox disulfide protein